MASNGNQNGRSRRRVGIVVAAIVAAVVLLAAFISLGQKAPLVRVASVKQGLLESTISTNGKIEPVNNFEAHAPSAATVRRVLVHEGDRVQAGQLLLEMDAAEARSQEAKALAQLRAAEADEHAVRNGGTHEEVITTQAQLAKAQGQVDTAQRNLAALRRLQEQGAASAGEVQTAEVRLSAAQSDLKLLQQKQASRYSTVEVERVQAESREAQAALASARNLLGQSVVRAPRAGTVYSLPVRNGQFVSAGDLLVQVADLGTMQARGFVDEPDLGKLRAGEEVQLTWDAIPGRIWTGTLTRVPSTVVALGARNVGEITCEVNNGDHKLLPNINVNVSVVTARAGDAVIVPREAVHQEDGQRFLYEVVDKKLRRRNIKTGITTLTFIQITEGLAQNAQVALGSLNSQALREGMPVRTIAQ